MDFKLPEMSKGTIIPNGIAEQQLKEAKEKELRKNNNGDTTFELLCLVLLQVE